MKHSLLVAAAAIAALVSSASVAKADDDATSVAAARTIGVEGLRLAEAGNCKDAIDKLDRSEKLHHAPTTLAKLGECHIQVGHLVVGIEMLHRVIREQLAPDAPPAFAAAKARAQKLVEETQPRIAHLHVSVAVPPGVVPVVTVDGEEIPPAMLDIDRPTDPGTHAVEASATGYTKAAQSVTLKEGERLELQLTPEAAPAAPAAAAPAAPAPPPAAPAPPPADAPSPAPRAASSASRTVGWVLLGVGAAGLVTGGVAGGLALGTKSSLDDACGANRGACPSDQEGRIDRLQRESLVSTIGFTVGAVGVVGGAALLFFAPSTKPAAASLRRPAVSVGLGSVSVGGSF